MHVVEPPFTSPPALQGVAAERFVTLFQTFFVCMVVLQLCEQHCAGTCVTQWLYSGSARCSETAVTKHSITYTRRTGFVEHSCSTACPLLSRTRVIEPLAGLEDICCTVLLTLLQHQGARCRTFVLVLLIGLS
jgi:hypothetical protein